MCIFIGIIEIVYDLCNFKSILELKKIKMTFSSKFILFIGITFLILTLLNFFHSDFINPDLIRAEVISGLASVFLMLSSILLVQSSSLQPKKINLIGNQGLTILDNLSKLLKIELAWGSKLILTATAASTILVYWDKHVLLRRGLISTKDFIPGDICKRVMTTGKLVSLVKTDLYPGKAEFNTVLENLPSIIIFPLLSKGVVIVGGWTERCFSKSDEQWINGWIERLAVTVENNKSVND